VVRRTMFEVGDKVVCVDDSPVPKVPKGDILLLPPVMVKEGSIYVIREIFPKASGVQLLGLEGASVLGSENRGNIPWNWHRFRKLSELQSEARNRKESLRLERQSA
jgi:hypothetical protein